MILASASPRRKALLEQLGFNLEIHPADIDERQKPGERALDYVCRLAESKADAVLKQLAPNLHAAGELYIAADTIVALDEYTVLGKPQDSQAAFEMLSCLSDRTHHVHTGVCLGAMSGKFHTFSCTTHVHFKKLTPEMIQAYIASGEPMDKAGAYGIQGLARVFVDSIEGDYENVVGLPIARIVDELAHIMNHADYTAFLTQYLSGARK